MRKQNFFFLIFLTFLSLNVYKCTYPLKVNFEQMNANMVDSIYFHILYEDNINKIDWTKDWQYESYDSTKFFNNKIFIEKNAKIISVFLDTLKKYTIYQHDIDNKPFKDSLNANYILKGWMVFYYTEQSKKILSVQFNNDSFKKESNHISYSPIKGFWMREIFSPEDLGFDIYELQDHIKNFVFLIKEELYKANSLK